MTYATWAVLAFGRDAALARIRSAILRLSAARGRWIDPDLLPLSAAATVE